MRRAQGDLPGALQAYEQTHAILSSGWRPRTRATPAGSATCRSAGASWATCGGRRATCRAPWRPTTRASDRREAGGADPGNAGWQRDLSVSWRGSATCGRRRATCRRAGGLPGEHEIAEQAGGARPGQRRLAARPVGQLEQARRRAAGAGRPRRGRLQAYSESKKIADEAGGRGPGQRRLAARPGGQLEQARRRAAGAGRPRRARCRPTSRPRILSKLADSDPGNAGWQRDLSVSWERLGDVRQAQGDLAGALQAYKRA